jgi:hypothetical protein
MPGGIKNAQAMGFFEVDKSWSGAFYGPTGVSRAVQVAALAASGNSTYLIWDRFVFSVVIRSFVCNYERKGAWLPYQITCVVLPPTPPPPTPTPIQAANSSLTTATSVQATTDPTSSRPIQTQATTAASNLQNTLSYTGTTGMTETNAQSTVSLGELNNATTAADNGVSSVNLSPGQSADTYVAGVNLSVGATSDVAQTNIVQQQTSAASVNLEQNAQLAGGYGSF